MKNVAIVFIFILALNGCGEEENSRPVIHLFQVSPTSVEVGGEVTLTVLATDKDGDKLSYIYQPGTGSVSGTGESAKWTAPDTPGKYSIKVNVSDGKEYTYSNVDITVVEKKVIQPAKDGIIVPGEQASGIRLGDSLAKVESVYGKGEEEVSGIFTFYTYRSIGISLTIDDNARIDNIFIFAPNTSKSAGGNGIGSTLVSVKMEFGEAEEIEGDIRHWYWSKGIEFDYDSSFKVVMIYIFSKANPAPHLIRH